MVGGTMSAPSIRRLQDISQKISRIASLNLRAKWFLKDVHSYITRDYRTVYSLYQDRSQPIDPVVAILVVAKDLAAIHLTDNDMVGDAGGID